MFFLFVTIDSFSLCDAGLLYFMIYMTAIAALILHDYRISFEFSVEDSLPLGTGFKVRSG